MVGRAKRAVAKKRRVTMMQRVADATPERLAKSEDSEFINPAEIDSSEQAIARVRRFRDSWIDRLRHRELLTYAQWFACGWYRDLHSMAFSDQRVVADYGQGAGGAGSGNYGQAYSEAQQRKRVLYRVAREHIPANMLSLVEGVILHDQMPQFANGQQRKRFAARFARAVQPLAEHIVAPGWWLANAVDEASVSR